MVSSLRRNGSGGTMNEISFSNIENHHFTRSKSIYLESRNLGNT